MPMTPILSGDTGQNCTEKCRGGPQLTLTVDQMAKVMNISRNTAYELVKQPGFPCLHVGKRILMNRDMRKHGSTTNVRSLREI